MFAIFFYIMSPQNTSCTLLTLWHRSLCSYQLRIHTNNTDHAPSSIIFSSSEWNQWFHICFCHTCFTTECCSDLYGLSYFSSYKTCKVVQPCQRLSIMSFLLILPGLLFQFSSCSCFIFPSTSCYISNGCWLSSYSFN